MKILFLDDDPARHRYFRLMSEPSVHAFTAVKSAQEAIQTLESAGKFDLVFLDHDLAEEHYSMLWSGQAGYPGGAKGTGRDVSRFISMMAVDLRPTTVVVHSMNPDGAKAMLADLRDTGVESHQIVFASAAFKQLMAGLREKSI